jgi:hypothetical protein
MVTFEGSHRVDMNYKNTNIAGLRGEYALQYKPQEPGIYLMSIKYGDDNIAGGRCNYW